MNSSAPLTLSLPKRYERLRDIAEENSTDLTRIVRKVPDATARIERLLKAVRDGGLGRFELFLGKSGSGKTTFLSTLPRFYDHAHIVQIPDTIKLGEVPGFIRDNFILGEVNKIFILLERDNPEFSYEEIRFLFEEIRRLFRTSQGRIVLIWPITDVPAATKLAEVAWEIGRDSIVDLSSKGRFQFEGLPKEDYYEVADITTRSLNSGQSLETFGISPKTAGPILSKSETISEFFSYLEEESQNINSKYDKLLAERIIPSVWILLLGDDSRELDLTVATLTQGTQKRLDVDRFISVLDDPSADAAYLKEWKKRRHEIAYILRRLDVRLFAVPPSVALAAVRAFGDQAIKAKLKTAKFSTDNALKANALEAIQKAHFFQALSGQPNVTAIRSRPTSQSVAEEFRRVQTFASKNDKALNKALASLVEAGLAEVGVKATVAAEKRAIQVGSKLQPDIHVSFLEGGITCLEPTWRTTGKEITGEMTAQQNTMTTGHIQQYLLAKVLEYVKDLGLS